MERDPENFKTIETVLHKKLFIKFRNIHWEAPVSEFLFIKVAGLQASNFIKKILLQHRCFPVNNAKICKKQM